ncbi:hypothetical protein M124_2181, partial [Bacteroides fragilis str. 3988T(B)14]
MDTEKAGFSPALLRKCYHLLIFLKKLETKTNSFITFCL